MKLEFGRTLENLSRIPLWLAINDDKAEIAIFLQKRLAKHRFDILEEI